MATITKFEEVLSWQEARLLNLNVGKLILSKRFGNNYPLIDQIVRSAGSIMDNIAEGFERGGNKEFIQFLSIAKASCGEFRSQMYRAKDLECINEGEFELFTSQSIKISSLIQGFIRTLKKSELKGYKYRNGDMAFS